ncbi:MAG: T9SS type A sorting domain-containing protein [Bacteroidetes bacterium]|nr:T9SS type A sorting domain-containing protein [Bacteroidota bacterium]
MNRYYKHIIFLTALFIFITGIIHGQVNQNSLLSSVQNYPNPFNPSTQIHFVLVKDAEVSIKIYNILGKEIVTLLDNKSLSAGQHLSEWNGKDKNGYSVSSGMYLYQVQAGTSVFTKKMSLLK